MRNRQPADQGIDHAFSRTSGARCAQSRRAAGADPPADAAAPAQTAAARSASHGARARCCASSTAFSRSPCCSCCWWAAGLAVRQPDRRARAARARQGRRHPQGRRRPRDRLAAGARGRRHRPAPVHGRLPVGEVCGLDGGRQARAAARPATMRSSRSASIRAGDRDPLGRQDGRLQGDGAGRAHQPPDRRAPEGRPEPHRRDRGRAAGGLAAARDLHGRARHLAPVDHRPHAGRGASKAAEKAWAQRKKDLPFKTLEEAIILASIVEKETGRNDERERVAAVFVNRLRQQHAAAVRSDHPLRADAAARWSGAGRSRGARSRRRPATTPTRSTACRRRRSATPAAPRSRPCSIPPTPRSSFSSPTAPAATCSPRTLKDHNAQRPEVARSGTGQGRHPARRRRSARHPHHGRRACSQAQDQAPGAEGSRRRQERGRRSRQGQGEDAGGSAALGEGQVSRLHHRRKA